MKTCTLLYHTCTLWYHTIFTFCMQCSLTRHGLDVSWLIRRHWRSLLLRDTNIRNLSHWTLQADSRISEACSGGHKSGCYWKSQWRHSAENGAHKRWSFCRQCCTLLWHSQRLQEVCQSDERWLNVSLSLLINLYACQRSCESRRECPWGFTLPTSIFAKIISVQLFRLLANMNIPWVRILA